MVVRYTPEQHAWMAANWRGMSNADVARAFNSEFGGTMTASKANAYGTNRHWHKDPGVRAAAILKARGKDIYTDEWREWFKGYTPYHTWRETAAESERAWGIPMTRETVNNWKRKLGVRSKIPNAGQIKPGNVPANKGRTWDEYMPAESQERSRRTCYRPGNIPHNALGKHVGYERVSKDGYVEVKVKDGLQGEANDNFRMKHHVVWEEANGCPVPPHTMIVFADHDRRNFEPENLVAVPRRIWATISSKGIPYYDAESLEVAVQIVKLKSAIYDKECSERPCGVCGETFKPRYKCQRTCDCCLAKGLRSPRRSKKCLHSTMN